MEFTDAEQRLLLIMKQENTTQLIIMEPDESDIIAANILKNKYLIQSDSLFDYDGGNLVLNLILTDIGCKIIKQFNIKQ